MKKRHAFALAASMFAATPAAADIHLPDIAVPNLLHNDDAAPQTPGTDGTQYPDHLGVSTVEGDGSGTQLLCGYKLDIKGNPVADPDYTEMLDYGPGKVLLDHFVGINGNTIMILQNSADALTTETLTAKGALVASHCDSRSGEICSAADFSANTDQLKQSRRFMREQCAEAMRIAQPEMTPALYDRGQAEAKKDFWRRTYQFLLPKDAVTP